MTVSLNLLDLIVFAVALSVLISFLSKWRTTLLGNLPPGTRRLPLIGNLLDLPRASDWAWMHWARFKDLHGPISSLSVFGKSIVIINDARIAFDLLEKKSIIYSDRPVLTFAGELCSWEYTLAPLRYGERFRAYRKCMHQALGTRSAISGYHDYLDKQTRRFLWKVSKKPENLSSDICSHAGAVILKVAYGYKVEPRGEDPHVALAEETVGQFSQAAETAKWHVDLLPVLRYVPGWVPGATFKRTAVLWKKTLTEMVEKPYAFVRQQMERGVDHPSFTSGLLERGTVSEEQEFIIKWSAASLYAGGADSTVSSMYAFFLAMVLYPDVQKKAQAELDAVVGADRLPTFEDRENLPYVNAIVKETFRWEPVVPMGFPHVSTEDDIYDGYYIPKGAIMLTNIWQFTHDGANYHMPFEFRPERFLGEGGRDPEMDPATLIFGFGRRICPGRELASASVFIAIAKSLAAFNITKARDANGVVITPVHERTIGVLSHPKEYKCSIGPRSEKAATLITAVEDHAMDVGDADVLSSLDQF